MRLKTYDSLPLSFSSLTIFVYLVKKYPNKAVKKTIISRYLFIKPSPFLFYHNKKFFKINPLFTY